MPSRKAGWLLFVVWWAFCAHLTAQDVHFSQYYFPTVFNSPSETGFSAADLRITAGYRQQWSSVPVPYQSAIAAADLNFLRTDRSVAGAGLVLLYDHAGMGYMQQASVGLSGAFNRRIAKDWYVGAGARLFVTQRSLDRGSYSFDSQYNGDVYDPDLPTMEPEDAPPFFYTDFDAGVHIAWQASRRRHLQFGVAAFHLNVPRAGFYDPDERLPRRYDTYLRTSMPVGAVVDFRMHALFRYQGANTETPWGVGLRYHLNERPDSELALSVLLSVRPDDAVIPTLEIDYRMWTIGLAYDWTISDFQEANGGRGAMELMVRYHYTGVGEAERKRFCPVY